MEPYQLTATEAANLIADRKLSVEELARSCLARIAARDPAIHAWLFVDTDLVIRNARELDKLAVADGPKTRLHGLPWGVKDIIDTFDMPTTQNSPIYPAVHTNRDAACVGIVRSSGALILGKTDTVEFASGGRKALSRNPFNPAHTPGGSSSGSGAAVGDFQVPLAFGTQTGGSHIRPAAFNGIYALKPTGHLVSREGVRMSSITLDTVGWYGRCVDDLILVAEAFRLPKSQAPVPSSPKGVRVGLCRSPAWHAIEPAGEVSLMTAAQRLRDAGAIVEEFELPAPFNDLQDAHADIVETEGGRSFLPEYLSSYAILAPDLRRKVENARGVTPERLLASYALADSCRPAFDRLFGPELDVILTPSAPGEAPEGLHTTGNAIFQRMWTLLHVPCVAIPVGRGPRNLPVGIQLIGPRMSDRRLLDLARILAPAIDAHPKAALRELCG
ncbi:MAG TPA: amidase [Rhodopila sp.]|uniref:amidase n=1 Tax=Rhodopila sp. TaxID=2480087 RepID=UPI002B55677E|nr:amidase [Rhodopila sp.]HVY14456.1 amidase [Rhodopila sp.]